MNERLQSLGDWVDGLERSGRYSFTLDEVRKALALEASALVKALQRLCGKGRLVRARRGFYVLVPLAYAASGFVPAEWFLPNLQGTEKSGETISLHNEFSVMRRRPAERNYAVTS